MTFNLINACFCRLGFYTAVSPLKNQQHNNSRGYIHVSKIKDAGAQVTDTNIHKISNMAVVQHPVNNISEAAGADKQKGEHIC